MNILKTPASIASSRPGAANESQSAAVRAPASTRRALSKQMLELVPPIVAVVDTLIIISSSMLMVRIFVDGIRERIPEYLIVTALAAVVSITALYLVRLYTLQSLARPGPRVPRVLLVFGGMLFVITSVFFMLKVSSQFSRAWLFSWLTITSVVIIGFRITVGRILEAWADKGILSRKVIILGAGDRGRALLKEIGNNDVPRVQVVAFFDDRAERYGNSIDGIPLLGRVSDLVEYLRDNPVAEILITLPWYATERIRDFTRALGMLPVDVNLIPDRVVSDFRSVRFGKLGSLPILQVSRRPISGWKLVFKWIEDRIIGGLIVVLAAPLLIVIAVAVKLTSPGPVFFRQTRYGFNSRLIRVFKFRTMYTHLTDENAERLTSRDDDRVTPLGRWLRKTSLDELPQLFNVFKGEMSLVGPRPHATEAKAADRLYEDVAGDYAARHRIKPGITGWAQVNGWRGETDTYEKLTKRVEYDLYYIENYSLWMDLRILLKTFQVFLKMDNAY